MSNDKRVGEKEEQRYYVTLYLNQGHLISFTCTEFITRVNAFGEYTEASWKGIDRSLSFNIKHLIAHTAEPVKVDAE